MYGTHIIAQIEHTALVGDNTLHVIGMISNPVRYHSRIRLFMEWYREMLLTPNVKVYVVEVAFGDRQFEVTEANNPQHLQLRTRQELWLKENAINLAVKHLLPTNWKYLCWSDCDVFWPDKGWAKETIHQLQHFQVVQPWQNCLDLGPYGEVTKAFDSFCYVNSLHVPMQTCPTQPYRYAHTGFVWACTRKFWENTRGLMEWCLVGSADHHMGWGMINKVMYSVHGGMTESFKRRAREWQDAAYRVTKGSLGYVKTRLEHKFHGSKRNRFYRERWSIFTTHKFDPDKDIGYDEQGLVVLLGKSDMEHEIMDYNRSRLEDGIEI